MKTKNLVSRPQRRALVSQPQRQLLCGRTQMEWVLLRFQLSSFMPWSDVRRIPRVRVGGLSIHITESLSSSKGRKNSTAAATSVGASSSSSSSTSTKSSGGSGAGDGAPPSTSSSSSRRQSLRQFDRRDSWEHQGRRASLSRYPSAGLDGSSGGTDGYELERVAQATLEHALGQEFTAKYQVKEKRKGRNRRLSSYLCCWRN